MRCIAKTTGMPRWKARIHFMDFPLDLAFFLPPSFTSIFLAFILSDSLSLCLYLSFPVSLCVMSFQSQVRNCRIQEYVQYFECCSLLFRCLPHAKWICIAHPTHKLDNFFMWISCCWCCRHFSLSLCALFSSVLFPNFSHSKLNCFRFFHLRWKVAQHTGTHINILILSQQTNKQRDELFVKTTPKTANKLHTNCSWDGIDR